MVEPTRTPDAHAAPVTSDPASIDLTLVEKVAMRAADAINNTPLGKRVQQEFLRRVSYVWVRAILARRCLLEGLDEVIAMQPDRGVLFVSNHRTFFDQYAIFLGLYLSGTPWCERIHFPVRSNFFYEHPLGMLVNWAVTANVMYPPVFRQRERAVENKKMVAQVVAMLREPGGVVGIHPEGTRGKGPDPYEMMPAQPGIGQIALQAAPIVIPVFIQGLSNDLVSDVRANFQSTVRRERPVVIVFGSPIDYSDLLAQKPRPTLYKKTSDLFRQKILELAPRERELRSQCISGQISDSDPRWLTNRPHNPFYARRGPVI
jgi:1-acyl-sn-glycerol-3-phosphate acyltransferase